MRIGTMWIAFNRVSRWPLLFSRKNHHNETASLPVSVPSLSPFCEKIFRRGGTLRNQLSLLPFLTRELFRLFWMDRWIGRGRDSASMPSILGNGEALEQRVNCDELGWGGERERCLEFRLFIGSVLDYFHRDILNGFLEISRNLRFFPFLN